MPEIVAHAPDGTELHFPDGTDPSVIQSTVKKHLGQPSTTNPYDNLVTPRQDIPKGPPQTPGGPSYVEPIASDKTIDFMRNILPPAAGAAAATVATPYTGGLGTFAAGTAGYTGMDQLLKSMKSGTSSESIPASLMDSLTSAVINEAGGQIGRAHV